VGARPISSNVQYATAQASRYVDKRLRPLVLRLPTVLGSSLDLLRHLENFTVPPEFDLASCTLSVRDVTALYPNIPIDAGIQAVRTVMLEHRDIFPDFDDIEFVVSLLHLVLTHHVNEFDGRFFRQLIGTAMGTSCAVTLAQIFMYHLERGLVHQYIDAKRLLFYLRYVDDMKSLFSTPNDEKDFWLAFNALTPTIEATGTRGRQVDFMDLTVYKGPRWSIERRLDCCSYFKPSHSYLYLPLNSFHTFSAKTKYIKGELIRFVRSNSQHTTFVETRDAFLTHLRRRGIPDSISLPLIKEVCYHARANYLAPKPESAAPSLTRTVFVTEWNPLTKALEIPRILRTHWHKIAQDPTLRDLFEGGFLVAYKNHENQLQRSRRLARAP
jgi:hypothetical protein